MISSIFLIRNRFIWEHNGVSSIRLSQENAPVRLRFQRQGELLVKRRSQGMTVSG